MNPAVLARLFQAQTDTLHAAQQSQGAGDLDVQREPGPLQWGAGQDAGQQAPMDLDNPGNGDPGAMQSRMQSIDDSPMPPSDYKYLDRVEGDGRPLGVMFGQDAGQPQGPPMNVPMSHLPPGAQEGQYISPLDIQGSRMSTRRP